MKLTSLKLTNYLSHRDTELDLAGMSGAVLLLGKYEGGNEGESNGSGKSAVMESVLWGLYGESRARVDDDLIRLGEDEVSVSVRFSMDGKEYEVVRARKRGKSQHLSLTNLTDDMRLSGNSVKETQAKIVQVLGMEAPVFVNSIYCRQNDLGGFASDTPARRKEILAEILQLDAYAAYEQKAKELADAYGGEAQVLEAAVRRAESDAAADTVREEDVSKSEEELAKANDDVEEARGLAQAVRTELGETKARAAAADKTRRDLAKAEDDLKRVSLQASTLDDRKKAELDRLGAEEASVKESAAKEPKILSMIAEVEKKLKDIGALVEQVAALREAKAKAVAEQSSVRSNRERLAVDLEKLRKRLAQVQGLGSKCPMCESDLTEAKRLEVEKEIVDEGQALRKEHDRLKQEDAEFDVEVRALEANITDVEKSAQGQRELERDRRRLEGDLTAARLAKEQAERFGARREEVEARYAQQADEIAKEKGEAERRADVARAEVDLLTNDGEKVKDLSAKLIDLDDKIRGLALLKDGIVSKVAAYRERIEASKRRRAQAEVDRAKAASARSQEAVFRELSRAFGKNGIPALIMDNALAEMQEEVKERVDQLSRGRIQVEFTTQRETKAGTQRETLDIRVSDEAGTRDFGLYSGGEKVRVAMGIRLALARIMSRRAGKRLESVYIDEVSDLDPAGLDAFADMVQDLSKEFSQVFVVSHLDELKGRFTNVVTVTKGRDGSRVEMEAAFV